MTYRELYDYGCDRLIGAGIENNDARLDARLLLEYICHTDRNTLLVHGDSQRNDIEEQLYKVVIDKRASRIPLQHITGEQEFMGLTFKVNEHTLIPRQDTEILVEECLSRICDGARVLDMCTGSGCILLSLMKYSNECQGVGADISAEALKVARENARNLGIKNVNFIESDLFDKIQGKYDMIVSNPPYIASNVIETLMPEVRDHEPMSALDGMEDGLFFYRRIVESAKDYMSNNAWLLFEIGYDQGESVSELMKKAGFNEVRIVKDYAGLDRVVLGRKER